MGPEIPVSKTWCTLRIWSQLRGRRGGSSEKRWEINERAKSASVTTEPSVGRVQTLIPWYSAALRWFEQLQAAREQRTAGASLILRVYSPPELLRILEVLWESKSVALQEHAQRYIYCLWKGNQTSELIERVEKGSVSKGITNGENDRRKHDRA